MHLQKHVSGHLRILSSSKAFVFQGVEDAGESPLLPES